MDVTLNDAAELLIQLEPDDPEEAERLCRMLETIEKDETIPEDTVVKIRKANDLVKKVIQKEVSPETPEYNDLIMETGVLIEEAMNEVHAFCNKVEKADNKGFETRKNETNGKEDDVSEPDTEQEKGDFPDQEKPRVEKVSSGEEQMDKNNEDAQNGCRHRILMPDSADPELVLAFITESSDLISGAEDALLALETNPDDMESVSVVFRAFHTIKGTSAFLELNVISDLAHKAESLLSRIRDGEIRYTGGYTDLALRALDMLKELLDGAHACVEGTPFYRPSRYETLVKELSAPEEHGYSENEEPVEVYSKDTAVPPEEEQEDEPAQGEDEDDLAFLLEPETDQEEDDEKEETDQEKPAPETRPANKEVKRTYTPAYSRTAADSTIRVPVERLDRFIDMVGELVVAHSMVVQDQVLSQGMHNELSKKVGHTTKIVRELQNMSMSMRMIPLKDTFRKMARLVRDLSRRAGKKVNFVAEGEDTEIDRNMVDVINDPLIHMVRNAVDHGIEPPDDREDKGKSPVGTVMLCAYHASGNVVVEIRDDGKGLDENRILEKAVERGIVDPDSEKVLKKRDIYNLIFEPGFSTAKVVSEISGRGVGMDVVKTNVEMLRGQVEVDSTPDKGSTFRMSLPLTLAIIDGMVLRVGDQRYVLSMVSIVRSVQPTEEELTTVLNRGEMITLQGKLIPIFRLYELFEIKEAETDPTKAIVVVVENDGQQAGLMIDELLGTQQIVIKTLGEAIQEVPGISGSAIMPNGTVGLILDVGGLVRLANMDIYERKEIIEEEITS